MTQAVIESIDALRSLEEGAVVTINGDLTNVWAREGDQMRRGEARVPFDFFAGDVGLGRVRQGVAIQPGQVYDEDYGYYRIVCRRSEDDHWWVALFHKSENPTYYRMHRLNVVPGRLVTDTETWMDQGYAMGRIIAEKEAIQTRLQEQAREVERERAEERTRLRTLERDARIELETWRRDFDTAWLAWAEENSIDTDEPIAEFMAERGLSRPRTYEQVSVDVTVNGRYSYTMDTEDAESLIGSSSVSIDDVRASLIDFTYEFSTESFTVEEGDCACGEVSRSDIETKLRTEGVTYDTFDFDLDCENC